MNYKLFSLFLLITITSCQTDIFDDANIEIINKAVSIKGRLPLIAHRGCWLGTEMPPNSLAAFINSLGKNIYGTEFDVYESSDKVLVINHEATYIDKTIQTTSYSELNTTKLSNGEEMPRLEDFIKAYIESDRKVKMIVDLKACNVYDVIELFEQYDVIQNAIFISFSQAQCDQLVGKGYGKITQYLGGDITPQEASDAGYGGINYSYDVFDRHPEWIREAQALGLDIGVWTLNDFKSMLRYIEKGAIVTTDLTTEFINEYQSHN